jgi:hypothetical protein
LNSRYQHRNADHDQHHRKKARARDIKLHVADEEILRVASEALGAFLDSLAGNDRPRARRAIYPCRW